MIKRLSKFIFVFMLFLCTFPLFSQIYEVENPDSLSHSVARLNCYWEFFPNTFINPELKTDSDDYNLGLISGFDDIINLKTFGSVDDLTTFSKNLDNLQKEKLENYQNSQFQIVSLLVDVPGSWNSYRLDEPFSSGAGAGSYRLLVKGLNPEKTYGFHVYDLCSNAFSIFVNGKNVITVGYPSEDYTKTVPDLSMELAYFKPDKNGEANFVMHISNFVHRNGGAWNAISFAEQEYIDARFRKQLNYGFLCLGALLTIFLYQMFLFIFRKLDFGSLYLALFAITILIRLIVTPVSLIEYFFPNLPYGASLKLEYVALILGPMLFTMYMSRKMRKMLQPLIVKIICTIGLILGIVVFSANAYVANRFVPIIQTYTVITCLYIFMMMILSFLRKPSLETGLMVVAVVVTITAAIHDIAALTNIYIILSSTSFISYAFIIFVFIQTLIIARQQEKSHKSVIRLTESLSQANERYSRFVPKEVLSLLNKKSLTDINPGEWTSQKATLLCFDIKQFSSKTEYLAPKEIFEILNLILGKISPVVREHGGFIEKYLGDGIIAIFPKDGIKAFDCAIKIQQIIQELQPELVEKNLPKISGGIAIHYGKIVLGTVGNSERLNQITVSKDIETVIKLESLTRFCGFNIISTRSAYEQWVPANYYDVKPLKEEITYQVGIKEMAYGILEKIQDSDF
ncbi:MAG: adenylate/guanylate cyclase domain-containing protein [Spirochaetaceae bacterium]|nr:adenylate/guanylate cyclase domain-containing protein [Spirochaetaceae bacterium]